MDGILLIMSSIKLKKLSEALPGSREWADELALRASRVHFTSSLAIGAFLVGAVVLACCL